MTQPIPVAEPLAPPLPDDEALQIREMLPAWLTSLVAHLSLILLLALLTMGGGGSGNGGVSLDVNVGEPGGNGGELLDDAMGSPVELDSGAELAHMPHATEDLSSVLEEALHPQMQMEMADLTGGASAGSGKGEGPGVLGSGGDGRSTGSGGEGLIPIQTQIFGLVSEGTRFLYVFDRSESMNSILTFELEGQVRSSITPLDAAKAELLRSLEDLDKAQQFQIIFYNHEPLVFNSGSAHHRLLRGTEENKRRATAFVTKIAGEGNTHHMEPLEIALGMRPDVVYLLTDGEPKDDLWEEQLARLYKLNKSRAKIHVIQFGFEARPRNSLEQLAHQTGGQHLFINIARLAPGLPDGPKRRAPLGRSLHDGGKPTLDLP